VTGKRQEKATGSQSGEKQGPFTWSPRHGKSTRGTEGETKTRAEAIKLTHQKINTDTHKARKTHITQNISQQQLWKRERSGKIMTLGPDRDPISSLAKGRGGFKGNVGRVE